MIATHTKLVDEARKHKFQGGEGTLLLNTASEGYWSETLFAREGRPWPPHYPTLAFLVYVCAVTTCADTLREYTGTSLALDSFSISAVSSCLFFLLVFRSNAAYQARYPAQPPLGPAPVRTPPAACASQPLGGPAPGCEPPLAPFVRSAGGRGGSYGARLSTAPATSLARASGIWATTSTLTR